jgi:phosphonate transport system permease protein
MTAAIAASRMRLDAFLHRSPYGARTLAALVLLAGLAVWSGARTELDRMAGLLAQWGAASLGLAETSQVGQGLGRAVATMFPPQVSDRTEVARIPGFDRDRLPILSHVEVERREEPRLDPRTLQMTRTVVETEVLVQPLGYLWTVLGKMVETIEIAAWATLIALLLSLPLAVWGAANYAPGRGAYFAARGTVSALRAVPELISALFLVLAFGFGPIPGVLALGLHAAGFLGKFFAEDIENADRKSQEAMRALGAGRLRILWVAVLPQVLPQYVAYLLYVLDRNLRMAAVIGLVGAGGIGQELKGRWDIFQYGHVATILLAIFITVFALDQVSARLRRRLIGEAGRIGR